MSIMANVDSKGVETLKALSVKSSRDMVSCLEPPLENDVSNL